MTDGSGVGSLTIFPEDLSSLLTIEADSIVGNDAKNTINKRNTSEIFFMLASIFTSISIILRYSD